MAAWPYGYDGSNPVVPVLPGKKRVPCPRKDVQPGRTARLSDQRLIIVSYP